LSSQVISAAELALQANLKKIAIPNKARPDFSLSAATGRAGCLFYAADVPAVDLAKEWVDKVVRTGVSSLLLLTTMASAESLKSVFTTGGFVGENIYFVDIQVDGAQVLPFVYTITPTTT